MSYNWTKYNNKKITVDGQIFDSKKEANRYKRGGRERIPDEGIHHKAEVDAVEIRNQNQGGIAWLNS